MVGSRRDILSDQRRPRKRNFSLFEGGARGKWEGRRGQITHTHTHRCNFLQRRKKSYNSSDFSPDMFLSESEDESEEFHSDSDSDSESSHCSLDEDYIPRGLAREPDL